MVVGPFGSELNYGERLIDFVLNPITGDVFALAVNGRIFRIDPESNSLTEIASVGGEPSGFDLLSGGRKLIVSETEIAAGTAEMTVHVVDLDTGDVTSSLIDSMAGETSTLDVAAIGNGEAIVSTSVGGVLLSVDAISGGATLIPGSSGRVVNSGLIAPSGDDRYFLLQEAFVTDLPMSIYDSVVGDVIATTDISQIEDGSINLGGADISSAGLLYNPSYGARIFDFSFQVVQDFSGRDFISIAFSNSGSLIYALTSALTI